MNAAMLYRVGVTITILMLLPVQGRLSGLSVWAAGLTGTAAVAESSTAERAMHPAHRAWLGASVEERNRIAEAVGESGARKYASSRGWKALSDGQHATLPQGLDQVYRSVDGTVHVIEAKGGSSQLGTGYGYKQGTSAWAVAAAERTVKAIGASHVEKRAAKAVLEAAENRRLYVHVIRTPHVLGIPKVPFLAATAVAGDEAATMASAARARLSLSATGHASPPRGCRIFVAAKELAVASDDAAHATPSMADEVASRVAITRGAPAAASRVLRRMTRAVPVVAAVIDVSHTALEARKIQASYEAGEITAKQRDSGIATVVARAGCGWAGAAGGMKLGGVAGAAVGSIVPIIGTGAGATVGALAGGVAGYLGGGAAAEAAILWVESRVAIATPVREHMTAASSWTASKAADAWAWAVDW